MAEFLPLDRQDASRWDRELLERAALEATPGGAGAA